MVLAQAAVEFLADPRLRSPLSAEELSSAITPMLDTLPESGEVAPEHVVHPAINAQLQAAIDLAPSIADQTAPENGLEPEALRNLFCRALSKATGKVLASDASSYDLLSAALMMKMTPAQSREVAWRRHANWIRHRFTQDPIFSPDSDETIPLAQVYLRTRCYWHTEEELQKPGAEDDRQGRDRREPETYCKAHLRDLHDTMHTWLLDSTSEDPVRIVAGGPSSGKSSFARAFATEVIEEGTHRLVFIQLQHMHRSDNLRRDIGKYLYDNRSSKRSFADMGFDENPLDWRSEDTMPTLLIFDGLDEMSTEEHTAKDIYRQFLSALNSMLSRAHSSNAPDLRAIVLGRSGACQEAMGHARMRPEIMLNVAKITPLQRPDLQLPDRKYRDKPDLDAETDLMVRDDRGQYWKRWRHIKRIEGDDTPEAVTSEKIRDLNAEPLLLHLLITSDYIGERWEEAAENPNLVYRNILSKIHDRNREKEGDSPARHLSQAEFFTLMECLGLAAWRGNGRTGTAEEFRELRDKHAKRERKKFSRIDAAELKTVALQIHTRRGADNEGFEFIHKSFGEYLSASALISAASRLSDRLRNDDLGIDPGDAAKEWADIIGGAELTPVVMDFLQRETPLALGRDRALEIKTDLEKVLGWVQEHGMPVHSLHGNASYRELESLQRCAEGALLVAATAITAVAQDPDSEEKIHLRIPVPGQQDQDVQDWDDVTPRRYLTLRSLHRLHATTRAPVARGLSFLDLRGANMSRVDLRGANLSQADLRGANLGSAELDETYLDRAKLIGADLGNASLRRADLHRADLGAANLQQAKMYRADLSVANLWRAMLSDADLSDTKLNGANLCRAHLFGVDLSEADLYGANFYGANLREAGLKSTNFRSVRLESCDLSHADLSETLELTQEQVNSAKGSKATTKLPEGLEYPDGWDDD